MDPTEARDFERVTLEKLRIGLRQYMSPEVMAELSIDASSDLIAGQMVTALRGFVWSNQIHVERQTTAVPATWWDHFKDTFFPDWLRRRMPIRTQTITTETKFIHTCPHLNISGDPNDRMMHLEWMKPPGGQYGRLNLDRPW